MNRTDRLVHHFEISVRTVYRDVSILGEAGVQLAVMVDPDGNSLAIHRRKGHA